MKDRSGGRRFWILICDDACDSFKFISKIDQDYINQVWAEVLYKFKQEQTPAGTRRRDTVCPAEIAFECFKIDNPNKDRTTLKKITEVLDQLPNWILKGRNSS